MFGHPTREEFALLSLIRRLLNDKTYRCVITGNGPVPQILKNIGVAVKVSRLSYSKLIKIRSILDSVRMIPMAVESLLV